MTYESVNSGVLPRLFSGDSSILVFSINNMLLFPKNIVEKENVRIVNYHNSLLPLHRGVHAEAWAIYEGDHETGITWHYVDSGIDTGDIVDQRRLPITESDTSLSLLKKQMRLAMLGLADKLDTILSDNTRVFSQQPTGKRPHLMRARPNDGILDTEWPTAKIWSFLRAYDYGRHENLGLPKIMINGRIYGWHGYSKATPDMARNGRDFIIPDRGIILKDLFPIAATGV